MVKFVEILHHQLRMNHLRWHARTTSGGMRAQQRHDVGGRRGQRGVAADGAQVAEVHGHLAARQRRASGKQVIGPQQQARRWDTRDRCQT